jgi:hypothetical protein
MREYKSAKMRGKEGEVVRRNSGDLVAKQPTGDFPRGGVEVFRCYLGACPALVARMVVRL